MDMPKSLGAWTSSIGALASVVLAVVSIFIAIELANRSDEQDARNRSFDLNLNFSTLDSRQQRDAISRKILDRTHFEYALSGGETYSQIFDRHFKTEISVRLEDVRSAIDETLKFSDSVFLCAWHFLQCNKEMLYATYFPQISQLYFVMRSIMYCDPSSRSYNESGHSRVQTWNMSLMERIETMLVDYLEWNHGIRGIDRPVFRTTEEADSAGIGIGDPHIILRPNLDTLCKQYPFQDFRAPSV